MEDLGEFEHETLDFSGLSYGALGSAFQTISLPPVVVCRTCRAASSRPDYLSLDDEHARRLTLLYGPVL